MPTVIRTIITTMIRGRIIMSLSIIRPLTLFIINVVLLNVTVPIVIIMRLILTLRLTPILVLILLL